MSKRFSETAKWRDPWFMDLPTDSKLLFLYLIDNCNNAGFWEENPRIACFEIGIDERAYQGALKGLARGIKGASGWLWLRRFLRHTKNEALNPQNNAHKQIIEQIRDQIGRFNGMPEFQEFLAPYEGLLSPTDKSTNPSKKRVMNEKETDKSTNPSSNPNVHDASAAFRHLDDESEDKDEW
jgi:hypothetical protein